MPLSRPLGPRPRRRHNKLDIVIGRQILAVTRRPPSCPASRQFSIAVGRRPNDARNRAKRPHGLVPPSEVQLLRHASHSPVAGTPIRLSDTVAKLRQRPYTAHRLMAG